jgi:hypothetical protein
MSYAGFCEQCQVPFYEGERGEHQHGQQTIKTSPDWSQIEAKIRALNISPAATGASEAEGRDIPKPGEENKCCDNGNFGEPHTCQKSNPEEGKALLASEVPKCGKRAASFIPRLGQYFACVLDKGHEPPCRPGGSCVAHGDYASEPEKPPKCPKCEADGYAEVMKVARPISPAAEQGKEGK